MPRGNSYFCSNSRRPCDRQCFSKAQSELHSLEDVTKDQARTRPRILWFKRNNAKSFPLCPLCLCFLSQQTNAVIMGLMQTEMPRNYTVPAKEQVRKLFVFCAKGNLQDYKEHIHIQEQCLSHFQLIFMLSITDSKSMHTHGVKVIGKGSQFVPQRLVLLTAWLQRIRLNLLFADVTGPQSCRADMNSWSPASKARLRAWQYILSQGPAKNMATSI